MLQLSGKVINVFTGRRTRQGRHRLMPNVTKVQLMGERALPNGDIQDGLMDLTINDLGDWNEDARQRYFY